MKLGSLITAILVAIVLYGLVFERDRVLSLAGRDAGPETGEAAAPSDDATADTATGSVSVVAIDSTAQQIDNAVSLRGQTEAARSVEVRAETAGLVASDPLRKGAFVEQGQLLCRIAQGTRPAQLAQAEAALAQARISQNAAEKLAAGGFTSETGRAEATAQLEAAEAAVAEARIEIERLEIHAPFDGLLETDTAEFGSLMQAGSLCATVIDLDPIKIVGYLPETQVALVETGAAATARLSSGREVEGRVSFVARASDPATRTFRVEITAENAGLSISDGLSAEISIAADGVAAHRIPPSALTLDDDGAMGLRLVDEAGRVRFARVRLVRDSPEGAIVTGLPEKVRIIVVGQEYVTEGVPVDVTLRGES